MVRLFNVKLFDQFLLALRALTIRVALPLLCTAAHSTVDLMSVSTGQQGRPLVRIAVSGSISSSDAAKFRSIASALDKIHKQWWAVVDLNTQGGSVQAALEIGTVLRERTLAAMVDKGASCMSACVYILAGAPTRIVHEHATIGIHRPYDPDDKEDSVDQQRRKQADLGRRILAYLQAMTIPIRLYEDSIFIPPDRMKILTSSEIASYGLSANDPSVDEANQVRQAKKLGITRIELGKRTAAARRQCGMDRMNDDTPSTDLHKAAMCMDKLINVR